MIKIVPLAEQDLAKVREMDPDLFLMLTEDGDVLKEYAHSAYSGERFLGAAFLYQGPSFRVIGQRKLPVYHLHMMISTVPGDEMEYAAINRLMDQLISDVEEIRSLYPGNKIVLRAWVQEEEKAALEFFFEKGFSIARVMPEFTYDLSEEVEEPLFPEGMKPEILSMEDAASFEAFVKSSEESFFVANSPEALHFQCTSANGKIYVLRDPDGRVVSGVVRWDIDQGAAATENIFTVPDHRNKGLAGALLNYVLLELQKEHKEWAVLSVFGEDSNALQFYLKRGFVLSDSRYELWYDTEKRDSMPLY